jgi:N-acetyl-alpha-D-glucosaminyl L-malate synthase BshA
MKIGITCYPTYGGSGVVATELGLELAKRGHEVHFISYSMPFRLKQFHENTVFHEVQVLHYPLFQYPPYTLALAAKLAEVADEAGLDLLHAHYAVPHAVCAYLAKEVARSEKVGADQSFRSLTAFGIDRSDGVTAVSQYLKRRTEEVFAPKRSIEVIPNFVDIRRFAPGRAGNGQREQFARAGERILVHISNFRASKHAPDVVRAFAAIRREVPSVLLMVGDGPDRTRSRDVAVELKVDRYVRFLGQVDDVEDVLCVADLFMLGSENESFGLAALEAMAMGVPVVATTAEGLPELIDDGEAGFLVPVGDIPRMARRAVEVLSNAAQHRAFSEAARRVAVERYDVARIVPMYEEFYARITAGAPVG